MAAPYFLNEGLRRIAMKKSDKLQKLADTKNQDAVVEASDSTCTNSYDNDGSTGREIFDNGYQLAQRTKDRDIFVLNVYGGNSSAFFIGTEEEVEAKLELIS